jgi:predicted O-methyltransferase YrrM
MADYLREAFGLPGVHLPLPITSVPGQGTGPEPAPILFDGLAVHHGQYLFVQIAAAIHRQRPDIPLLAFGGTGHIELPGGGRVRGVEPHELSRTWAAARVFLSPLLRWDEFSSSTLVALAHGVPTVLSSRSAAAEFIAGAGQILPLPNRLTDTVDEPLQEAELAPWVNAALKLYRDESFAAAQRKTALTVANRWHPTQLAPLYARFLKGLASRRHSRASMPEFTSPNEPPINLDRLAEANAWPTQRPEDAAPGQEQGWLGGGTETMLARSLSSSTRLVVELGAWLGLSTRFIANKAPGARIISVDHWKGSPEHNTDERYAKLLPRLYETFQARCWDYREQIVPLRVTTLDGLRQVAEHGLKPDFIYVDAEHTYQAVTAELNLAHQLFPEAVLSGDDYDWPGVRQAVNVFARQNGLLVDRFGERGWRLLEPHETTEDRLPPGRGQSFVLVPHIDGIEMECEKTLQALEARGVRVERRAGCSAIDAARNELASLALHEGADSLLFIDSDIGFDPADALRLLARPEPVLAGIYPKKGVRALSSAFAEGVKEALFGPEAPGLYPLKYAATGFLRIRTEVLRHMITQLQLPLCNTRWGRGMWPFFLPMVVSHGPDKWHYLAEDWAFSHRLAQIGITPLADTSFRLWHWGRYGFSWEDAGSTLNRFRSYNYGFKGK